MKAPLVPRKIFMTTLAGLLIPASASAHPGHCGHGVDPATTTNFPQELTGLGPLSMAVAVTCLALFFIRNTYRKLP
jgi:hypothetical protein